MVLADIDAKISELTQVNSTIYPTTNRLINLNVWYRNIQTEILQSQDDWDFDDSNTTDYPILTANITSGQQAYILPTNTLEIKRAEVCLDGTNWHKLTDFDIGERLKPTDANSLSDFSASDPYYDLQYGSIFLYPIPTVNVSGGLKIWISRLVTEFTLNQYTQGTMEPGFDALFHDVLAYGSAFEWLLSRDLTRATNIKTILDEKIQSLRTHFGRKIKDEDLTLNSYPVSYR